MSNVLVVAEVAEGKIRKATLSAVTFAREVVKGGGSFALLVMGANAKGAAAEVTGMPGVSDSVFQEVVREIGREALAENAEWLVEHRHHKIEPR